jgi:hypothetical protein
MSGRKIGDLALPSGDGLLGGVGSGIMTLYLEMSESLLLKFNSDFLFVLLR